MASAIILNIPHSSTVIPAPFKKLFTIEEPELYQELLNMTDWYTDELFDQGIGKAIIAPVSRLVCDTERFSHDEDEPMAKRGMGFFYTHGSKKQRIKKETTTLKDEALWRYYAPHHIKLIDTTEEALIEWKKALIIDCHSFSSVPLPYEMEQSNDRPDICIGTDDFHTPKSLSSLALEYFENKGYKTAINYPYSGSIAPLRHYGKNANVSSIMIEINRGLYLKPGTNEKNDNFNKIKKDILDFEIVSKEALMSSCISPMP
ncbi:MAG: N-formylglutamate amidohydrolase [Spirochaetales bacterium]|nr:N-formylglutamate amidohydrolase [Spirochaetales bacterium]